MNIQRISRRIALPLLLGLGMTANSNNASAGCSGLEPFIGNICLVGFNFCPRGWAEASGQLLLINQNQALFSLYGTQFGGDGRTTFALPDLRGRTPISAGQGPGLGNKTLGSRSGAETATLAASQMPSHAHAASTDVNVAVTSTLRADADSGDTDAPGGAVLAKRNRVPAYSGAGQNVDMSGESIQSTATTPAATTVVGLAGSGNAFGLRDPYLTMRYCVALTGVFPSRN